MMLLANIYGGYFSYVYKSIGLSVGMSDRFLTWAGSFAAIVQALSRLTCGALYDIYGFRKIYMALMIINIVTSIICYPARYQ